MDEIDFDFETYLDAEDGSGDFVDYEDTKDPGVKIPDSDVRSKTIATVPMNNHGGRNSIPYYSGSGTGSGNTGTGGLLKNPRTGRYYDPNDITDPNHPNYKPASGYEGNYFEQMYEMNKQRMEQQKEIEFIKNDGYTFDNPNTEAKMRDKYGDRLDLLDDRFSGYMQGQVENERLGVIDAYKDFVDENRYNRQGYMEVMGRALKRTIGGAFYQTVSGLGAILDFEDYFNTDNEVGNWLSNWADAGNTAMQQANEIYTSKDRSLTSFNWWMKNGADTAASIASFAAQGAGFGAVIGKGLNALKTLSRMGKAGKLIHAADDVAALAGTGRTGLTGSQILTADKWIDRWGTGVNALMLNQAESIMEAAPMYKEAYDAAIRMGHGDEYAKQVAANAASTVVSTNRVNFALNMTSANRIMKAMGVVDDAAEAAKRTWKQTAKDIASEAAQEAVEEGINVVASAAGKTAYQNILGANGRITSEQVGYNTDSTKESDFLNTVTGGLATVLPINVVRSLATGITEGATLLGTGQSSNALGSRSVFGNVDSDELYEAMLLGALGGAGNTALTEGVISNLGSSEGFLGKVPGLSRFLGRKKEALWESDSEQKNEYGEPLYRKGQPKFELEDVLAEEDVLYTKGSVAEKDYTVVERDEKGNPITETIPAKAPGLLPETVTKTRVIKKGTVLSEQDADALTKEGFAIQKKGEVVYERNEDGTLKTKKKSTDDKDSGTEEYIPLKKAKLDAKGQVVRVYEKGANGEDRRYSRNELFDLQKAEMEKKIAPYREAIERQFKANQYAKFSNTVSQSLVYSDMLLTKDLDEDGRISAINNLARNLAVLELSKTKTSFTQAEIETLAKEISTKISDPKTGATYLEVKKDELAPLDFAAQVLYSLENNSEDTLRQLFKDIAKMSKEEAEKAGYGESYRKDAEDALNKITKLKELYTEYTGKHGAVIGRTMYMNRANYMTLMDLSIKQGELIRKETSEKADSVVASIFNANPIHIPNAKTLLEELSQMNASYQEAVDPDNLEIELGGKTRTLSQASKEETEKIEKELQKDNENLQKRFKKALEKQEQLSKVETDKLNPSAKTKHFEEVEANKALIEELREENQKLQIAYVTRMSELNSNIRAARIKAEDKVRKEWSAKINDAYDQHVKDRRGESQLYADKLAEDKSKSSILRTAAEIGDTIHKKNIYLKEAMSLNKQFDELRDSPEAAFRAIKNIQTEASNNRRKLDNIAKALGEMRDNRVSFDGKNDDEHSGDVMVQGYHITETKEKVMIDGKEQEISTYKLEEVRVAGTSNYDDATGKFTVTPQLLPETVLDDARITLDTDAQENVRKANEAAKKIKELAAKNEGLRAEKASEERKINDDKYDQEDLQDTLFDLDKKIEDNNELIAELLKQNTKQQFTPITMNAPVTMIDSAAQLEDYYKTASEKGSKTYIEDMYDRLSRIIPVTYDESKNYRVKLKLATFLNNRREALLARHNAIAAQANIKRGEVDETKKLLEQEKLIRKNYMDSVSFFSEMLAKKTISEEELLSMGFSNAEIDIIKAFATNPSLIKLAIIDEKDKNLIATEAGKIANAIIEHRNTLSTSAKEINKIADELKKIDKEIAKLNKNDSSYQQHLDTLEAKKKELKEEKEKLDKVIKSTKSSIKELENEKNYFDTLSKELSKVVGDKNSLVFLTERINTLRKAIIEFGVIQSAAAGLVIKANRLLVINELQIVRANVQNGTLNTPDLTNAISSAISLLRNRLTHVFAEIVTEGGDSKRMDAVEKMMVKIKAIESTDDAATQLKQVIMLVGITYSENNQLLGYFKDTITTSTKSLFSLLAEKEAKSTGAKIDADKTLASIAKEAKDSGSKTTYHNAVTSLAQTRAIRARLIEANKNAIEFVDGNTVGKTAEEMNALRNLAIAQYTGLVNDASLISEDEIAEALAAKTEEQQKELQALETEFLDIKDYLRIIDEQLAALPNADAKTVKGIIAKYDANKIVEGFVKITEEYNAALTAHAAHLLEMKELADFMKRMKNSREQMEGLGKKQSVPPVSQNTTIHNEIAASLEVIELLSKMGMITEKESEQTEERVSLSSIARKALEEIRKKKSASALTDFEEKAISVTNSDKIISNIQLAIASSGVGIVGTMSDEVIRLIEDLRIELANSGVLTEAEFDKMYKANQISTEEGMAFNALSFLSAVRTKVDLAFTNLVKNSYKAELIDTNGKTNYVDAFLTLFEAINSSKEKVLEKESAYKTKAGNRNILLQVKLDSNGSLENALKIDAKINAAAIRFKQLLNDKELETLENEILSAIRLYNSVNPNDNIAEEINDGLVKTIPSLMIPIAKYNALKAKYIGLTNSFTSLEDALRYIAENRGKPSSSLNIQELGAAKAFVENNAENGLRNAKALKNSLEQKYKAAIAANDTKSAESIEKESKTIAEKIGKALLELRLATSIMVESPINDIGAYNKTTREYKFVNKTYDAPVVAAPVVTAPVVQAAQNVQQAVNNTAQTNVPVATTQTTPIQTTQTTSAQNTTAPITNAQQTTPPVTQQTPPVTQQTTNTTAQTTNTTNPPVQAQTATTAQTNTPAPQVQNTSATNTTTQPQTTITPPAQISASGNTQQSKPLTDVEIDVLAQAILKNADAEKQQASATAEEPVVEDEVPVIDVAALLISQEEEEVVEPTALLVPPVIVAVEAEVNNATEQILLNAIEQIVAAKKEEEEEEKVSPVVEETKEEKPVATTKVKKERKKKATQTSKTTASSKRDEENTAPIAAEETPVAIEEAIAPAEISPSTTTPSNTQPTLPSSPAQQQPQSPGIKDRSSEKRTKEGLNRSLLIGSKNMQNSLTENSKKIKGAFNDALLKYRNKNLSIAFINTFIESKVAVHNKIAKRIVELWGLNSSIQRFGIVTVDGKYVFKNSEGKLQELSEIEVIDGDISNLIPAVNVIASSLTWNQIGLNNIVSEIETYGNGDTILGEDNERTFGILQDLLENEKKSEYYGEETIISIHGEKVTGKELFDTIGKGATRSDKTNTPQWGEKMLEEINKLLASFYEQLDNKIKANKIVVAKEARVGSVPQIDNMGSEVLSVSTYIPRDVFDTATVEVKDDGLVNLYFTSPYESIQLERNSTIGNSRLYGRNIDLSYAAFVDIIRRGIPAVTTSISNTHGWSNLLSNKILIKGDSVGKKYNDSYKIVRNYKLNKKESDEEKRIKDEETIELLKNNPGRFVELFKDGQSFLMDSELNIYKTSTETIKPSYVYHELPNLTSTEFSENKPGINLYLNQGKDKAILIIKVREKNSSTIHQFEIEVSRNISLKDAAENSGFLDFLRKGVINIPAAENLKTLVIADPVFAAVKVKTNDFLYENIGFKSNNNKLELSSANAFEAYVEYAIEELGERKATVLDTTPIMQQVPVTPVTPVVAQAPIPAQQDARNVAEQQRRLQEEVDKKNRKAEAERLKKEATLQAEKKEKELADLKTKIQTKGVSVEEYVEYLKRTMPNVSSDVFKGIELLVGKLKNPNIVVKEGSINEYDSTNQTITLLSNKFTAETFAHELIHALYHDHSNSSANKDLKDIQAKLFETKNLKKFINSIVKSALAAGSDADKSFIVRQAGAFLSAGISTNENPRSLDEAGIRAFLEECAKLFNENQGNVDELIAYVFNSPAVAKALNGIKYEDGKSFLEKILDAIKSFVSSIAGIKIKENSLLAKILSVDFLTNESTVSNQSDDSQAAIDFFEAGKEEGDSNESAFEELYKSIKFDGTPADKKLQEEFLAKAGTTKIVITGFPSVTQSKQLTAPFRKYLNDNYPGWQQKRKNPSSVVPENTFDENESEEIDETLDKSEQPNFATINDEGMTQFSEVDEESGITVTLDYYQKQAIIEGLTSLFLQKLRGTSFISDTGNVDLSRLMNPTAFLENVKTRNDIKEFMQDLFAELASLPNVPSELANSIDMLVGDEFEGLRNYILSEFKKRLRVYNINLNEDYDEFAKESVETEGADTENLLQEGEVKSEVFDKSAYMVDPSSTVDYAIRLLIGGLRPYTVNSNGDIVPVDNTYGMPKLVDINALTSLMYNATANLQVNAKDSAIDVLRSKYKAVASKATTAKDEGRPANLTESEELILSLKDLFEHGIETEEGLVVRDILSFRSAEFVGKENNANINIITEFNQMFMKAHPDFTTSEMRQESGKMVTFSANEDYANRAIRKRWESRLADMMSVDNATADRNAIYKELEARYNALKNETVSKERTSKSLEADRFDLVKDFLSFFGIDSSIESEDVYKTMLEASQNVQKLNITTGKLEKDDTQQGFIIIPMFDQIGKIVKFVAEAKNSAINKSIAGSTAVVFQAGEYNPFVSRSKKTDESTEVAKDSFLFMVGKLAAYENTKGLLTSSKSFQNATGEKQHGVTLPSTITTVTADINNADNKETLFKLQPHLRAHMSQNSVFLKYLYEERGVGKRKDQYQISVGYTMGVIANKAGEDLGKLSPLDKFALDLSNIGNRDGMAPIFNLLRAADRTTETTLMIKNKYGEEVKWFDAKHVNSYLFGYLVDEVAAISNFDESDRSIANFGEIDKSKPDAKSTGEKSFRLFDKIDDDDYGLLGTREIYNKVLEFAQSKPAKTQEEIREELNKINEQYNLFGHFDAYFKKLADGMIDYLLVNEYVNHEKLLLPNQWDDNNSENKSTADALQAAVEKYIKTTTIGYVEQIKLFIGDPLFFKNANDIFKRIKMFNGTRKVFAMPDDVRDALNGDNRVTFSFGNKEVHVRAGVPKYRNHSVSNELDDEAKQNNKVVKLLHKNQYKLDEAVINKIAVHNPTIAAQLKELYDIHQEFERASEERKEEMRQEYGIPTRASFEERMAASPKYANLTPAKKEERLMKTYGKKFNPSITSSFSLGFRPDGGWRLKARSLMLSDVEFRSNTLGNWVELTKKDSTDSNKKFFKRGDFEIKVGANNTLTFQLKDSDGSVIVLNDDQLSDYVKEFAYTYYHAGLKNEKELIARMRSMIKPFLEVNEADGESYCTLPFYKQILIESGKKWNDQLEYSYQKALKGEPLDYKDYEALNLLGNNKFEGAFTKLKTQATGAVTAYGDSQNGAITIVKDYENDVKVSKPVSTVPVTGYKHSLMPLIPSLIKDTPLEKLNEVLIDGDMHLAQFVSAVKYGAIKNEEGGFQSFYKEDGTTHDFLSDKKYRWQEIHLKHIGVQVDMATSFKGKITTGTQFRKLLFNNTFEKGVGTPEEKALYEEYRGLQEAIYDYHFEALVKEFGISIDEATGKMKVKKRQAFADAIANAMIDEGKPFYEIEAVQNLWAENERAPIEMLMDSRSVVYMFSSLLNSRVIKEKRKGESSPQAAATGWEKIGSFSEKRYDNHLKMYRKSKDGKTLLPAQCKMALPYELIGYVETKYNGSLDAFNADIRDLVTAMEEGTTLTEEQQVLKKVTTMVGFRIPSQGLSSSLYFQIVEFLPTSFGNTMIVPSLITAVAGSDFDIDKINWYSPHYTSKNGKLDYFDFNQGGGEDNALKRYHQYLRYEKHVKGDTSTLRKALIEAKKEAREALKTTKAATREAYAVRIQALKEELYGKNDAVKKAYDELEQFLNSEDTPVVELINTGVLSLSDARAIGYDYFKEGDREGEIFYTGLEGDKVANAKKVVRILKSVAENSSNDEFKTLVQTLSAEIASSEEAVIPQAKKDKNKKLNKAWRSLSKFLVKEEILTEDEVDEISPKDRISKLQSLLPSLANNAAKNAIVEYFIADTAANETIAATYSAAKEEVNKLHTKLAEALLAQETESKERLQKELDDKLIEIRSKDQPAYMTFQAFQKLSIEHQNRLFGMQNRMLELHTQIMSNPSRYTQLMSPNSDAVFMDSAIGVVWDVRFLSAHGNDILNEYYKEVKELETQPVNGVMLTGERLKQAKRELYLSKKEKFVKQYEDDAKNKHSWNKIFSPQVNLDKFLAFLSGKAGVGIAALQNTFNVLSQYVNLELNATEARRLIHDYNEGEGGTATFGSHTSKNGGEFIIETISAFINAYVDVAKDPFIFEINAGLYNASVIFNLIRTGANLSWVAKYMKQPLIEEFTRKIEASQSSLNEAKYGEKDEYKVFFELFDKYKKYLGEDNPTLGNVFSPGFLTDTGTRENKLRDVFGNRKDNNEILKYLVKAITGNKGALPEESLEKGISMKSKLQLKYKKVDNGYTPVSPLDDDTLSEPVKEEVRKELQQQLLLVLSFIYYKKAHAYEMRNLSGLSNWDTAGKPKTIIETMQKVEDFSKKVLHKDMPTFLNAKNITTETTVNAPKTMINKWHDAEKGMSMFYDDVNYPKFVETYRMGLDIVLEIFSPSRKFWNSAMRTRMIGNLQQDFISALTLGRINGEGGVKDAYLKLFKRQNTDSVYTSLRGNKANMVMFLRDLNLFVNAMRKQGVLQTNEERPELLDFSKLLAADSATFRRVSVAINITDQTGIDKFKNSLKELQKVVENQSKTPTAEEVELTEKIKFMKFMSESSFFKTIRYKTSPKQALFRNVANNNQRVNSIGAMDLELFADRYNDGDYIDHIVGNVNNSSPEQINTYQEEMTMLEKVCPTIFENFLKLAANQSGLRDNRLNSIMRAFNPNKITQLKIDAWTSMDDHQLAEAFKSFLPQLLSQDLAMFAANGFGEKNDYRITGINNEPARIISKNPTDAELKKRDFAQLIVPGVRARVFDKDESKYRFVKTNYGAYPDEPANEARKVGLGNFFYGIDVKLPKAGELPSLQESICD